MARTASAMALFFLSWDMVPPCRRGPRTARASRKYPEALAEASLSGRRPDSVSEHRTEPGQRGGARPPGGQRGRGGGTVARPMKMDVRLTLFLYLVGIFLTCLLVGDLIGGKLTSFTVPGLGQHLVFSVGQLSFPLTFVLTDIINEFYGRKVARKVT